MRDDNLTRRGPKRQKPIDTEHMSTLAIRVPASLLFQLDEETRRLAHETGVQTLNRSDVGRALLAEALASRALRHTSDK